MATITNYLDPRELKKLANLQLLARQVVEGFCSGLHRSPHKGFSVEFKQHRAYVHGDELRRLDWKVYGKTDRFYIREYEEETNLRATLLLDQSGSMDYRGKAAVFSKFDYAVRLAASLAYLMLQQQDAVGLATFDEKLRTYVPPRARPAHLTALTAVLDKARPGRETEIAEAFRTLVPTIPRRGLLILLSDCFGDVTELLHSLALFRHRHHEILVFQLWDRDELDFPFRTRVQFESLELPGDQLLVDPAHLRATYVDNLARFREELRQGCHRNRIDLVPLVTDQPFSDALSHYLAVRRGRG